MPAYDILRVKNIANTNPDHPDQIGVERNGTLIYLSNTSRDLAEADAIVTEPTATLQVAAESTNAAVSDTIIDIDGSGAIVIDWEVVTAVDQYYDDDGEIVYEFDNTVNSTISIVG